MSPSTCAGAATPRSARWRWCDGARPRRAAAGRARAGPPRRGARRRRGAAGRARPRPRVSTSRVERGAREARAAGDEPARRDLTVAARRSRSTPPRRATSTTPISVERDGDGSASTSTSRTSPPTSPPGRRSTRRRCRRGNSVYVPGAVEPMLPEALSSDACSLVPGLPRKAVTVEMVVDGRARCGQVVLSQPDPLRRAPQLRARSSRCSPDGRRPRRRSPSRLALRSRGWRRSLRERRLKRGALGVETAEPEFEFDADGQRRAGDRRRADGVAQPDRGADDPGQRAGGAGARRAGASRLLYRVHEQPEPEAIEFLVGAAREPGRTRRRRFQTTSRPRRPASWSERLARR